MNSKPFDHYHKHYFSVSFSAFNVWSFLSVALVCLTLFAVAARFASALNQ
jgi:hypothetical protein